MKTNLFLLLIVTIPVLSSLAAEPVLIPQVDGEWWTVAGDPDLGKFTTPKQQPVDFAVWQASDGTWQLWSCIRQTACGGKTRLFHRWQGAKLTDKDWEPMGIAMQADPAFGETPGGLQAPHVIKVAGEYRMFYGDWVNICQAKGVDGKTFARQLTPNGKSGMFSEGPASVTRDVMLFRVGELYHAYYTAAVNRQGSVYARTSPDLTNWSTSRVVALGGSAGTGFSSAECPFVVYHKPTGYYYLFRTQTYGGSPLPPMQTSVYRSKDPMDFGVNDDKYLVCTMPVAAPEIVEHEGQYYIASLSVGLKGIRIAKMKWAPEERR